MERILLCPICKSKFEATELDLNEEDFDLEDELTPEDVLRIHSRVLEQVIPQPITNIVA